MECLPDEQLFFYSEGLLEAEEARGVAAHLKSCESCAARYLAELELTVALRELPAPLPSAAVPGRVVTQIRASRAGSASAWWWIAAFGLLVASGLRWLAAGDLSLERAALSLVDFLWNGAVVIIEVISGLGDPSTWTHFGRAFVAVAEMTAGSPLWLASSVAAALMVAVAANVLLWSVAKRTLVHR